MAEGEKEGGPTRTLLTTASLNSTKRRQPTGAEPASAASKYTAMWSRLPLMAALPLGYKERRHGHPPTENTSE